jgi:hypothetical protein
MRCIHLLKHTSKLAGLNGGRLQQARQDEVAMAIAPRGG